MSNGTPARDLEVTSLSVAKNLVVPGKGVINELLVRTLYVEIPSQNLQAAAPAPVYYQQVLAAPPSAGKITQVYVQTTCVIPLSIAGTGNWLSLKECAQFTDATPFCLQPSAFLISDDYEHLVAQEAGIYKIECCLRVGSCGFGQHSFNVGIAIGEDAPARILASCISFGATLDAAGTATGMLLVEVPEPGMELQLCLRDDSSPTTDAAVFQGTLILTKVC